MRPGKQAIRFVRALMAEGAAVKGDNLWRAGDARLDIDAVAALASGGVVEVAADRCRPLPEARAWLKRAMLDGDAFAAQHRTESTTREGSPLNLDESPLARLATALGGGEAFLAPHQVEAGERVRRLVERAQLRPRVTMSYSASHTAGGKSSGHAAEITDMAADARRRINQIITALPRDCGDVVLDVCGFLKGLQQIETERGWPRRSAKLVLRIGLEQVAGLLGLSPRATGVETRRPRVWLDGGARPMTFG